MALPRQDPNTRKVSQTARIHHYVIRHRESCSRTGLTRVASYRFQAQSHLEGRAARVALLYIGPGAAAWTAAFERKYRWQMMLAIVL